MSVNVSVCVMRGSLKCLQFHLIVKYSVTKIALL